MTAVPSMLPDRSAGYLAAKARSVRAARLASAPVGAALERVRSAALAMAPAPPLRQSLLVGDGIALIAEFKRRSPSGGTLCTDGSPAVVASLYEECGARGVSVLTDGADFSGSLDDLAATAEAVALPVLRKDFLVDLAALCEARTHGASAALLIVAVLTQPELESLLRDAAAIRLECLVEVHDEDELDRALGAGATLIGINNRDLHSLTTDLAVTERLAHRVPSGIVTVSESGIRTAADVARVGGAGAHAVLVGEALLRERPDSRCDAVRALAAVSRQSMQRRAP